jgi:hypothetical protein
MADRKPPKVVADEVATWVTLYQFQRESLVGKLDGLSEEDARRPLVPSGTSVLWLVKHCTRGERLWFFDRFAAQEEFPRATTVLATDTIASVSAAFREQWPEITGLVSSRAVEDLATRMDPGDDPVTLRWIMGHMLEEVARHAGHADILREQIDGQTGR